MSTAFALTSLVLAVTVLTFSKELIEEFIESTNLFIMFLALENNNSEHKEVFIFSYLNPFLKN